MRCLYCGKELALFKRLRGGEFCSDAHRKSYQEEYTQLALNRLLQAKSSQKNESAEAKPQEIKPVESDSPSPALKRRERLGREEAPAGALSQALGPGRPSSVRETAGGPAATGPRSESGVPLLESQALGRVQTFEAVQNATARQTAVLDPSPATAAIPALIKPPAEEPAPAGMSSFLPEFPEIAIAETVTIPSMATNLELTSGLALPRWQEMPRETAVDRLDLAGRVDTMACALRDFQTPLRERWLELREFVRGVPQVEIRVRPASETGFEPVRQAFEVHFDAHPPDDSPLVWQVFGGEAFEVREAELLLGDLARLDFAVTGWEDASIAKQTPPASDLARAVSRLEPMRVEVHPKPASRESSRTVEEPAPLRFEPVHIDPVFMEQIASGAEFNALKKAAARETSRVTAVAPQAKAAAPVTPPSITKPAPVTLHGLAPARGKPVQVFTSAVSREGVVQIPRDAGLPLRPIMVLGAVTNLENPPANVPPPGVQPKSDEKAAESKPTRPIPVPVKREPRPAEIKARRPETSVLPVQVKEEARMRQKDPARATAEAAVAGSKELSPKDTRAEKPAAPLPVESGTGPERPNATAGISGGPAATGSLVASIERPFLESRTGLERPTTTSGIAGGPAAAATTVLSETKPRTAPSPRPEPPNEPDLLGLPKLSYRHSDGFWSRLPALVRIGAIAAILALIVGGVMLTSRGSGAPKAPPANNEPAKNEPQMVEVPSALASAGWVQDWFADAGSSQGRHVDVLRGSLTLRDYRLVFEGQIESGALGWVFRANDKSFYVEKIQVVTPGMEPVVALVHFAVIDGQEQPRTQVPLHIKAHLDTTYKVRMDAVGNRFTTWVQDEKVDQWTDSRIDAGGAGLYYDSGDSAKLRDTLNVIPLRQK